MKKTFTLFFILFIVIAVNAQDLQKDQVLLGGTIGFNRQKMERENEEDRKDYGININPSIGKFYRNNRMAGVNVLYSRTKSEVNKYTYDSYGLGVFLRQYLPLGKSFYLFAEENASYNRARSSQQSEWLAVNYEKKQSFINLTFYPGIAYSLNRRLLAELALNNVVSLSYLSENQVDTYTNGSPTVKTNVKSVGLSTGLGNTNLANLLFGLRWVIR